MVEMETYIVFVTLAATMTLADTGISTALLSFGMLQLSKCNGCQRNQKATCSANQDCSKLSSSIHLVGRSSDGPLSRSSTPDDHNCRECCSSSLCNNVICNHTRPSSCVDDPSIDCARISSILSVCEDIHKAKMVCPKFCNLCNIVDGNWNTWSSWSGCDVMCGNGNKSRFRTCTDPAPQNGGLDCIGNSVTKETCFMGVCPIHGGWSLWSSWGSCSVTCDIGIQRRDRSCDNPYPSNGGNQCYGDSRDDQICNEIACSNGGWSSWTYEIGCSTTCGGGLQNGNRMCNSPAPSLLGRPCEGPNSYVRQCNVFDCAGPDMLFKVGLPHMTRCLYSAGKECLVYWHEFISPVNTFFYSNSFRAPKTGTYKLQWDFISTSQCDMTCYIRSTKHVIDISAPLSQKHASSSEQIQLEKSDEVFIDMCRCNGSPYDPGLNDRSTFTVSFLG